MTTTRSSKRFAIRGGEPPAAYEQDPHTGDVAQVEQVGRDTGGLAGRGGGDPVL